MDYKLYSKLKCAREDFPYNDTVLNAVVDRESTIRTQHIADILSSKDELKEKNQMEKFTANRYILSEAMPLILEGLEAVFNRVETKEARKDKEKITDLKYCQWKTFAGVAFNCMLNNSMRHRTQQYVIKSIATNCEIEEKMKHYEEENEKFYKKIMKQQLSQGQNLEHIQNVMTVAMNRRARGEYGDAPQPELTWIPWTSTFANWIGNLYMDIIIQQTGLFQLTTMHRGKTSVIYVEPTDRFLTVAEETEKRIGQMGGYFLPLPIPPRDWINTKTGGYWTTYVHDSNLIRNNSKGYQEEMLNQTETLAETVFPAVNAAQHTAWRINTKVYDVIKELWDTNSTVAGLPKRNVLLMPPCPKCGYTPKKEGNHYEHHVCFEDKEVLTAWKQAAACVHKDNVKMKSLRISIEYGLETAELLLNDERFYYVYRTDFRGRLYPCGMLHPQGTDWQKGILEFADGVELGEHGAKWLKVHLANCWANDGIDKLSYDRRIAWTEANEEMILACAKYPLDVLRWADADSPFCFLAACFEYAEYKKIGDSYKSHIAVALDGSCSGIQHYSAMLKDEVGALATNVKMKPNADHKEDIYQRVADTALELMQKDLADAETGEYATTIIANKLMDRNTVKRAVMTLPYGSTYSSCMDYVDEKLRPKLKELGIEDVELRKITVYAASKVWKAIPFVVQAAREGMDYLQKLARLVAKAQIPVTWQTPTGFFVQQSYYTYDTEVVRLCNGGKIVIKKDKPVWIYEDANKANRKTIMFQNRALRHIDNARQISGIAPNFIHSLDSSHLMFSVKTASEAGIKDFALIHDSLGTHAGQTEQFAQIIRQQFHDLYVNYDPLKDITDHLASQILEADKAKLPDMPEEGDLDLNDILKAEYLFS